MEKVKNYEIAYLLRPSINEDEVLAYSHKLSSWIEENKGVIKYSETPKKRRLAYPMQKETSAYFGWITFTATASAIKLLAKNIKDDKVFLRHLLVDRTGEDQQFKPFRFITPRPAEQVFTAPEKPVEEKLDLGALDKKLEEILGK